MKHRLLKAKFFPRPLLFLISVVLISGIVFTPLLSGAPEEKHISIFSTVATYSLPVVDSGNREYVGLLEALEPLGSVSFKADRKHWRLRYNDNEVQFEFGKSRVKMKDGDFDLGAPFVMLYGRGMVPISALESLLSRILGGPVAFNPSSRRVFIGNIAVHFTARVSGANPPSLIMSFTAPVNPTIATDSGKLRMTFTHDPVVSSGTQTLTFGAPTIPSATYEDGNGNVSITVAGTAPLFATFSKDRRTITIAPATTQSVSAPAQPPSTSVTAQATSAPVPTGSTPPPTFAPQPAAPTPLAFVAVIDASHGGSDRGATLSDQMLEKDITLEFAQRLQREMATRGLTTLLLRNADTDLSLDQRAGETNAAHPSIYICIHATSQGDGVSLYTSLLPPANPSHGLFLDWDTAQTSSLAQSQADMEILATSLGNSKIPARKLAAPLRPLNNVTVPAIAIEIAPRYGGASRIDSSEYQSSVASAIANGIAAIQQQTGSRP